MRTNPSKTWPATLRWIALLALSSAGAAALELIGIPAALLLGPMLAAVVFAVRDQSVDIPAPIFLGAQSLIGCLIAAAITPDILGAMARDWPLFCAVTLATLGVSVGLGLILAHWQVLPGTVALWGSLPGMATAMVLMARDYGEDYRLVAFMTYLRVVCVAVVASLLALALGGHSSHHPPWFPPIHSGRLAETLAVAAIGAGVGLGVRLPAGALLGPAMLGTALNIAGVIRFELPGWMLAIAYALVGWRIGLRFTRDTVRQARHAFVRVLLSTALLIGFCWLAAWALTLLLGKDPVTAYLATSPGGMDSVAIIASTTRVDVSFVMALQSVRLVLVLLLGPAMVRSAVRWFKR